MGYSSRLPVYQSIYNGSLKDVTTLNTTLAIFRELAGDKRIIVVMDKGFFSTRNVNAMLGQKNHTEFLLSVPFTCAFARKQIDSERKDIDVLENTIVVGGDSLRAVTKVRKWSAEHSVYTHIYYNARKAMGRREDLFAYVSELQERALATPEKYVNEGEYSKYLLIRRSVKQPNGYTVTIRNDVVQRELERAGWMVIISNCVDSARDAIKIYREKDVAEKGFLRLKNRLDLDRLRMHSHEAMQNKVFIGFLSLILLTDIHNTMLDRGLYKSMTIKKLVLNLSKLRVQEINGTRILFPLTKVQKEIYKAFSLPEPL